MSVLCRGDQRSNLWHSNSKFPHQPYGRVFCSTLEVNSFRCQTVGAAMGYEDKNIWDWKTKARLGQLAKMLDQDYTKICSIKSQSNLESRCKQITMAWNKTEGQTVSGQQNPVFKVQQFGGGCELEKSIASKWHDEDKAISPFSKYWLLSLCACQCVRS